MEIGKNGYQNGRNKSIVEPRLYLGPDASPKDLEQNITPTQGQLAVVLSALFIGLLLMGVQLWLLSVALDLYLSGSDHQAWLLPLISGLIFVGGLFSLRMLRRQRPPSRR